MYCFQEWDVFLIYLFSWQIQKLKNTSLLSLEKKRNFCLRLLLSHYNKIIYERECCWNCIYNKQFFCWFSKKWGLFGPVNNKLNWGGLRSVKWKVYNCECFKYISNDLLFFNSLLLKLMFIQLLNFNLFTRFNFNN